VAADPAHETCILRSEPLAAGASAICVYRPGSLESYLMASALPATPDGMVYQLWYADEAGVHALGTFAYDGHGAFVAPFTIDLASASAVMVTLEPVGGATNEPGPEVVFGEL
jgi:anti-sigma-K factor RskA